MSKNILIFGICLIIVGSLSAQNFIGKINPYPSSNPERTNSDSLSVLAVMVSFQEDRDGATFGNGKFGTIYSRDYGTDIIDPLPHDKDYFESHLTFARNYFRKVSRGKLNISFTVLPDTFSVSRTMRNYSPDPDSTDFKRLGQFAQEVWSRADQLNPGFNFSDYDVFLIFHAGVGRDISLPGSLGNERDLPSVYLNENAFKTMFGSDYEGIPVSGGSFRITNSMIIPETESRELETISGKFLFEISINGLLAASIASHLGLPDLFDTETGLSAIGRFGLMDGQSIFAYNGLFPPEPSAWEKIFLGWSEPVAAGTEGRKFNLTAGLAASLSDTVILKVPINSSEYYLIENRGRDVYNDGAKVTMKSNGNIINKSFTVDTTGFFSYDTDSLSGVILDIDEYDWALPGNGIVIWHIDENVINEKLSGNEINTDKSRRGVDVEEADGIQDIGETFITIFGDEVIGEGTEQDFWYSGNKAELYKNIFSKNTRPDTKANSGANSLITISDFSAIGNVMSFEISYGDSIISPLFNISLGTNPAFKDLTYFEKGMFSQFLARTDSTLILIDKSGNPVNIYRLITEHKPAAVLINDVDYLLQPVDSTLYVIMLDGTATNYIPAGDDISTSPVVLKEADGNHRFVFGTADGRVLTYSAGTPFENPVLLNAIIKDTSLNINKISGDDSYFSFIAQSGISSVPALSVELFFDTEGNSYSFTGESPLDLAVTKDREGRFISIVLTDRNNFYVIAGNELLYSFGVESMSGIESFSLTDLRKDGNTYILFRNGDKIEARNLQGALADNYPVFDPEGYDFVLTPLAMDFEGDDRSELISFTEDGRILAFDGPSGKLIYGFPVSSGASAAGSVLFSQNNKPSLAVLSVNNFLSGWNIGSVDGKYFWSEINGNAQNSSFVDAAGNTNQINTFFPVSRAYNYPNPVYEGQTAIRYYVAEDSRINIKIFDLAGDFVAELNDDAEGGFDNETIWNVSGIQSGVYIARIEASGSSGKSETATIKIAVVK